MFLTKFSKLPMLTKFPIFSGLYKKSSSVFIYNVITILIFSWVVKRLPTTLRGGGERRKIRVIKGY